jgi:hypothetical protein
LNSEFGKRSSILKSRRKRRLHIFLWQLFDNHISDERSFEETRVLRINLHTDKKIIECL